MYASVPVAQTTESLAVVLMSANSVYGNSVASAVTEFAYAKSADISIAEHLKLLTQSLPMMPNLADVNSANCFRGCNMKSHANNPAAS